MFDALTITADVAQDEHAEAVEALRRADITVELEHVEAREVLVASFVHDGTRPEPDVWKPLEAAGSRWKPLEERVRGVLATRGIDVQAVGYGIESR